jgi:hypothetical protein
MFCRTWNIYFWRILLTFHGNLVHFMVIWYILCLSGISCDHVVYIVIIWYILWLSCISCDHVVYIVIIWYILWSSDIYCGHLVYFMVIWYIFFRFGILYYEKSGKPGRKSWAWYRQTAKKCGSWNVDNATDFSPLPLPPKYWFRFASWCYKSTCFSKMPRSGSWLPLPPM